MSAGEDETRARRRKPQESDEQSRKAAIDAALATAVDDPLVRTPAKPPDPSKVDEKWDLEDDEDWVEGQSPGGERTEEDAELSRRRKVLKRDSVEAGTALLVHLIFMCVFIYIHVYDATIVKKTKGKGFPGIFTYGGRWKFLTYWNLWIQFIYFFLCFFTDIMPWSSAKYWFLRACDVMFTSICIPVTTFVSVIFWGIYAADREQIHPAELDKYIPAALNHCQHTFPLLLIVLEGLIVFHRYPSNAIAALTNFAFSTLYIVWIVWVFTMSGNWPYPFFKLIPLPGLPVFFTVNFFISMALYFVGKLFCYLRWKERHDVMGEMGL